MSSREQKALQEKGIGVGDTVRTAFRGGVREGVVKEITEKPQVVFTRRRKGQPDKEVKHSPSTLEKVEAGSSDEDSEELAKAGSAAARGGRASGKKQAPAGGKTKPAGGVKKKKTAGTKKKAPAKKAAAAAAEEEGEGQNGKGAKQARAAKGSGGKKKAAASPAAGKSKSKASGGSRSGGKRTRAK